MSTLAAPRPQPSAAPPAPIGARLRRLAESAGSKESFYRGAIAAIAEHFRAPFAQVQIADATAPVSATIDRRKSPVQAGNRALAAAMLETQLKGLSGAQVFSMGELAGQMSLAAPVFEWDESPVGAIALLLANDEEASVRDRLAQLEAWAVAAGALAREWQPAAERLVRPVDVAPAFVAAGNQTLREFAYKMANGIKSQLGCERASLGVVRGRHVRVLCISGLEEVYPRSPGAEWIRQAMEECLDARNIVCVQPESAAAAKPTATGHRLHGEWSRQLSGAAVASLPLTIDGRCIAVLSLANAPGRAFRREDLQKTADQLASIAPGLLLLAKAERSLAVHGRDALFAATGRLFRRGAWGRKALLAGVLAIAGWLAFGEGRYVVTVPCKVAPAAVRDVRAPFDGVLLRAPVEPGQHVLAGDLLIEMDTADLRLERDRLVAERQAAEVELASKLAENDLTAAAQARARMDLAKAELAGVAAKIERAAVRAPVDGIVLVGEARLLEGAVLALGAPLLQFAPDGAWSVKLYVPEYAASRLTPGQTGAFTTEARPDEAQICRVARVESTAHVVDGRNAVVAEARVDANPEWIRVGMTGYARIDVGSGPAWRVQFQRVFDSLRFAWWRL